MFHAVRRADAAMALYPDEEACAPPAERLAASAGHGAVVVGHALAEPPVFSHEAWPGGSSAAREPSRVVKDRGLN